MDEQPAPLDDITTAGSPASPDALRSIVAKHRRGRTRTLGILLAVALVAGPVAGWALAQGGGGGQQLATGSQPNGSAATPQAANAPAGAGNASSAIAIAGPNMPNLTHLFTRTSSDGIVLRAYRADAPTQPKDSASTTAPSAEPRKTVCPQPMTVKPGEPAPGPETGVVSSGSSSGSASGSATASASASSGDTGSASGGTPGTVITGTPPPCAPSLPPVCKAAPSIVAEASNDAAVGQTFDPIDEKQPTDPLSHLSVMPFGVPEGSPAMVVTVQTGTGVASVRLRLPSGDTDAMAPNNGIAVLAHGSPQPAPDGTVVEALDGSGNVLASMPVSQPGPKTAMACAFAGGPNTVRQVPLPAPATPPTTR
jgi:hypothetical protein